MNENLNLIEILKDCPKWTKLWSPLCGDCRLVGIYPARTYPVEVVVSDSNEHELQFDANGLFFSRFTNGECMIFPSKDQRDWSKFQRAFKDGDVIYVSTGMYKWVSIFKEYTEDQIITYTDRNLVNNNFHDSGGEAWPLCQKRAILEERLATEEEKQKLFDAIKANGYKWNAETKTLENIKFIDENELVPNKFDPGTLKPFDRVLVRDLKSETWRCNMFSDFMNKRGKYKYRALDYHWSHCIPYNDETKHLLGKVDMEPEYYQVDEYDE